MKARVLLAAWLWAASWPAAAAEIGRVPDLEASLAPVAAPAPAADGSQLPGLPALASPEAAAPQEDLETPAFLRRNPAAAAAVAAARTPEQRVQALQEALSKGGRADAGKAQAAFDGLSPQERRLKVMTGFLPAWEAETVSHFVLDGAPEQAAAHLAELKKKDKRLRRGDAAAQLKALERRLRALGAGSSEAVRPAAPFVDRLERARRALRGKRFAEAAAEGAALKRDLKGSDLRRGTVRSLYNAASSVAREASVRGASVVYGRRGPQSAEALARRAAELSAADPTAYAGAPLSGQPTRLQCYHDCAVQQAFNHPANAEAGRQMPYFTFLNAVESRLSAPIRREGANGEQERLMLYDLGLSLVPRGLPRSAEDLVERLRRHGALSIGVRWKVSRGGSTDSDHAVVLQGALREPDGSWRFVVIDSNQSRPQLYSFAELSLINAQDYRSVEPMAPGDKRLPKDVRGMQDVAARTALLVNRFYGRHGAYRERVALWKRAAAAVVNRTRQARGLEPWEPEPRRRLDPNLLPLGRAPPAVQAALRAHPDWRARALVAAPDGRLFLNKLVLRGLGLSLQR